MKILFILTNSALRRGMNTGLENLAWGLAERGIEVHVLSGGSKPYSHEYELPSNVHYYFTDKDGNNPITFISKYKQIVDEYNIDGVVGWILNIAALATLDISKNIAFVSNQGQMPPRSVPLSFIKRALLQKLSLLDALKVIYFIKKFSSRADKVVSNSNAVQRACIKSYFLHPSKCQTIHRGVDTEIYKRLKNNRNQKITLLFTGNIAFSKGLNELVEGLEFLEYPVQLVLCGSDKQNYITLLKQKMNDKKVHELKYLGVLQQDMLASNLQRCDVFVFPSHTEGMPKSLLEALSCGCAVVCSDIPPHKEIIKHEHNGLLAKVKSPKDIASAINRFISDESLRKECGINARKTVEERFSKDAEIDSWMNVLHECIERRRLEK